MVRPVGRARRSRVADSCAAIIDSLKTRLDLAAVEAEIYLVYVAQLLLWGFAAVACALLAIVFALTAVVIALWATHPHSRPARQHGRARWCWLSSAA